MTRPESKDLAFLRAAPTRLTSRSFTGANRSFLKLTAEYSQLPAGNIRRTPSTG